MEVFSAVVPSSLASETWQPGLGQGGLFLRGGGDLFRSHLRGSVAATAHAGVARAASGVFPRIVRAGLSGGRNDRCGADGENRKGDGGDGELHEQHLEDCVCV